MTERDDLVARLRRLADQIDREVSRTKSDIEDGVFGEIELMRESADEIERLRAALLASEAKLAAMQGALEECGAGFILHEQRLGERDKPIDHERIAREFHRRIVIASEALSQLDARAAAMVKVWNLARDVVAAGVGSSEQYAALAKLSDALDTKPQETRDD